MCGVPDGITMALRSVRANCHLLDPIVFDKESSTASTFRSFVVYFSFLIMRSAKVVGSLQQIVLLVIRI